MTFNKGDLVRLMGECDSIGIVTRVYHNALITNHVSVSWLNKNRTGDYHPAEIVIVAKKE